jgi:hypothetical protein
MLSCKDHTCPKIIPYFPTMYFSLIVRKLNYILKENILGGVITAFDYSSKDLKFYFFNFYFFEISRIYLFLLKKVIFFLYSFIHMCIHCWGLLKLNVKVKRF